jgi:hypothetical protein
VAQSKLRSLLSYNPETAGGLMNPDFVAVLTSGAHVGTVAAVQARPGRVCAVKTTHAVSPTSPGGQPAMAHDTLDGAPHSEPSQTAVLDDAHVGDIRGALGRIAQHVGPPGGGHRRRPARLIKERFGRFWGLFSIGDLFVLDFLTIVT